MLIHNVGSNTEKNNHGINVCAKIFLFLLIVNRQDKNINV